MDPLRVCRRGHHAVWTRSVIPCAATAVVERALTLFAGTAGWETREAKSAATVVSLLTLPPLPSSFARLANAGQSFGARQRALGHRHNHGPS